MRGVLAPVRGILACVFAPVRGRGLLAPGLFVCVWHADLVSRGSRGDVKHAPGASGAGVSCMTAGGAEGGVAGSHPLCGCRWSCLSL